MIGVFEGEMVARDEMAASDTGKRGEKKCLLRIAALSVGTTVCQHVPQSFTGQIVPGRTVAPNSATAFEPEIHTGGTGGRTKMLGKKRDHLLLLVRLLKY